MMIITLLLHYKMILNYLCKYLPTYYNYNIMFDKIKVKTNILFILEIKRVS